MAPNRAIVRPSNRLVSSHQHGLTAPWEMPAKMSVLRSIILVFACLLAFFLPALGATQRPGYVRICLASDFEWGNEPLLIPEGLLFEGPTRLCGDLYQPTELQEGDPRLGCYRTATNSNEDFNSEGFVTNFGIVLSKLSPCGIVSARTYLSDRASTPEFGPHAGTAFIAYNRLATPPEALAVRLRTALENIQIRAAILGRLRGAEHIRLDPQTGVYVPSSD